MGSRVVDLKCFPRIVISRWAVAPVVKSLLFGLFALCAVSHPVPAAFTPTALYRKAQGALRDPGLCDVTPLG